MEHRGDGPDQAGPERDLMDASAQAVRPGGLLHYGQGKWYPGEQLPRWSLNLFWRADGEPIWHDPACRGRARRPRRDRRAGARVPASPGAAARRRPAQRLRRPTRTRGTTCGARASCRATSTRSSRASPIRSSATACAGLRAGPRAAGRLRPADRAATSAERGRWRSSSWFLRGEHCYLIPGDSPLGYRLPLDSLPWAAPATCRGSIRPTPMPTCRRSRSRRAIAGRRPAAHRRRRSACDARARAAERHGRRTAIAAARDAPAQPRRFESAGVVVAHCDQRRAARTAASTSSCRRPALEDYLELVAAVEDTAARCGCR